jgi:hypothetical protein
MLAQHGFGDEGSGWIGAAQPGAVERHVDLQAARAARDVPV